MPATFEPSWKRYESRTPNLDAKGVRRVDQHIGFIAGWEAAVQHLRELADARDNYLGGNDQYDEAIREETRVMRYHADMLEDPDRAWGWLPSWLWDKFGLNDPTAELKHERGSDGTDG